MLLVFTECNYKKLKNSVGIKIIPSGNWVLDLERFSEAIDRKIWTASRTDMTMMGGITFCKKAIELSENANIDCEIMSWGYTLVSVANLHLMLSSNNCTYYEQPLPYETFKPLFWKAFYFCSKPTLMIFSN